MQSFERSLRLVALLSEEEEEEDWEDLQTRPRLKPQREPLSHPFPAAGTPPLPLSPQRGRRPGKRLSWSTSGSTRDIKAFALSPPNSSGDIQNSHHDFISYSQICVWASLSSPSPAPGHAKAEFLPRKINTSHFSVWLLLINYSVR